MIHPALARRWDSDDVAYGGWVSHDAPWVIDGYASADYDCVTIDCQHSLLDDAQAARMVAATDGTGPALFVRVSDNRPALIGKVLDAGADGVIVPAVNDRSDAQRAVESCLYPPSGVRSYGPIRAGLGAAPRAIESRAVCLVMMETAEALADIGGICSVPGLGGVYVGPADLSIALGRDPSTAFSTDQLEAEMRLIGDACRANSIVFGAHATDVASARRWIELGCALVTIGSSTQLFGQAARRQRHEIAGPESPPRSETAPPAYPV